MIQRSNRAIGIVRVSEVNGREGERFVSPRDQRSIIERDCARQDLDLVKVFEELDVSGFSRQLAGRPGLSQAVRMIECGEANVLVVAYFDRLFRNLSVQREVTERVERAGGKVLAVDAGEIRTDTASRWITATMLGMVAEYHSRITREKTQDAKERAIANGIPTFANIPPGYRRGADRRLQIVDDDALLVRQAFEQRAMGTSLLQVDRWARRVGLTRSFRGTQEMLHNRIYRGELRFGQLVNLQSHPAIIDEGLFETVQRMRVSRGAKPTYSPRLLARQGIVQCGTCGSRMVVNGQTKILATGEKRKYADYRCNYLNECTARTSISADVLESKVLGFLQVVQEEQCSTLDEDVSQAEAIAEDAQEKLARAVGAFDGLGDLDAVRSKLLELRAALDEANEQLQRRRDLASSGVCGRLGEWHDLTLNEQRTLVRGVIKRIVISRGGPDAERIRIEPYEQPYAF